jgi:hypothetical protein
MANGEVAMPDNDNDGLSDGDVERISQRVAELLFHKLLRRVAKAAQVSETVSPCPPTAPRVKPSAEAFAAVRARRARKGVF